MRDCASYHAPGTLSTTDAAPPLLRCIRPLLNRHAPIPFNDQAPLRCYQSSATQ